ncbi:MAG: type IX secretion system membrane protein PorP/SprF [Pedobacter sp.]|nr:MAG: type IX secretion system membrane protein PorP/SprF [Pedobacter sp.]
MKFFCLFILSFITYTAVVGQETPRSTQYVFNNYLLNPALSGIDSYVDLKLGYRKQWSGLDGAPSTQYLSLSAPLGEEFVRGSINSFSSRGYNPLSRSFVNTYTAAEPHHGIGLVAMTDKAGLIRQSNINFTYAYHLGLTNEINLAVGASAGVNFLSFNATDVRAESTNDPLFAADYNNRFRPDVGVGLWLYSPRFFIGASAKQLLGTRSVIEDSKSISLPYQSTSVYATAGYKIFLDEDIAMIPSFLASYRPNSPAAIDANLKLAYQDKFWLGTSYRNNDSFSILAGFGVASFVNLSYSYDVNTSALRSVNNGTHEIVLGFLLNNKYEVKCSTRQF